MEVEGDVGRNPLRLALHPIRKPLKINYAVFRQRPQLNLLRMLRHPPAIPTKNWLILCHFLPTKVSLYALLERCLEIIGAHWDMKHKASG